MVQGGVILRYPTLLDFESIQTYRWISHLRDAKRNKKWNICQKIERFPVPSADWVIVLNCHSWLRKIMPKEKKEHDFLIGIKCSCLSNYLLSIFFVKLIFWWIVPSNITSKSIEFVEPRALERAPSFYTDFISLLTTYKIK